MRVSCGVLLLIGSLVGIVMSFISEIVVTSSISAFDGMDISIFLGVFFAVTFLGSIFVINSST